MFSTMNTFPKTLSGVHRRSKCCRAAVEHRHPIDTYRFSPTEELECARCKGDADDFEVVNALDEVIWPVPRWFRVPRGTKLTKTGAGKGSPFVLHVGRHTYKRLFRG